MNNQGKIAIGQIMILVVGIFAFAGLVGAQEGVQDEGGAPVADAPVETRSPDRFEEGATLLGTGAAAKTSLPTTSNPVRGEGLKDAAEAGDKAGFDFKEYFFSGEAQGATQIIAQTAAWALTANLATRFAVGLFGFEEAKEAAIVNAATFGFGAGRLTYNLASTKTLGFGEGGSVFEFVDKFTPGTLTPQNFGIGMGVAVAALIFFFSFKDTEQEVVEYVCEPWQAPTGGSSCEECNKQGILPCSEYQCRSLGQACELVNQGTDEEKCVWINPRDVEFPIIQPWQEALLEDYVYTPDNAISPPDRGVIIENSLSEDACVEAFTPLTFGIELNEPGQCKVDYLNRGNFSNMEFFFGGSTLFRTNHTQVMSLPGKSAYDAENIEIRNDGDYELFVRCMDRNGNANTANFVFKFCVDKGPDTTAPAIISTSVVNGAPIAHNQSSLDLIAYVNEPAECRWDRLDQEYDDMANQFSCASSVTEINAQMLYECTTTLDGLKNSVENDYYFRCKDQPSGIDEADRNTNTESFEFTLQGTIPLVVNEVGPNGTVSDNTDPVRVTLTAETSAGAEEGIATCYYKEEGGEEEDFIEFFNTNSHEHSQDLFLDEGTYTYNIRCVDLGGNQDEMSTEFIVDSDSEAPIVARAYHEENNLKIVTDEEAECVYDVLSCNYLFDDGISLTTLSEVNHFTEWDTSKNFYVKCRDQYGNQPTPSDACSIIVKPFEIF